MTTVEALKTPRVQTGAPPSPMVETGMFAKPRPADPEATPTQVDHEIRWEADAVQAGVKRYRKELNNRTLADTSPGLQIMREIMEYFVPAIDEFQKKTAAGIARKKSDWPFLVHTLKPEALAYLTLRAIMSERPTERAHQRLFTSCATVLANSIELEVSFQDWKAEERASKREKMALGQPYQDLYERMKRSVKKVDQRAFRAWMKRLYRLYRQPWPRDAKYQLGANLINTVTHGSKHFVVEYATRGKVQATKKVAKTTEQQTAPSKTVRVIQLSDAARSMIEDEHARREIMQPPHRPMLCQPKPWRWEDAPPTPLVDDVEPDDDVQTDDEEVSSPGRYVGGYLHLSTDLIHNGPHRHTAALRDPLSAETLRAINTLQSTPWRINRAVYDVMQEAIDAGSRLGDLLPPAEPEFVGDRFPKEVWAAMSKEAKAKETARREKIHTENAHDESHRYAWRFRLDMAKQVVDEPMIWFPHGADFRGRLYAEVNDLSPQSSDEGKALLEFAHGKPLGDDGLAWLYIRAASCYATEKTPTGEIAVDKLPFRGREQWAKDHLDLIHDTADHPLDFLWWTEAEDPWCFLATCFEISAAVRSGDPHTFISHLPIPLDGSCNGLQHLSALGRDRDGALATNVISENGERRDVYSEVAERLKKLIAEDAGKGNKLALEWQPEIKRSLVKQAVMTTPYGVSDRGIARQLLKNKDKPTAGFEEETPAANYLRDRLVQAIDQTVSSATKIKEWLAAVAGALAEHEIPFLWQTPTGNTLQQAYWGTKAKRVKTLAGQITLQVENPVDPVLYKLQKEEEQLRRQKAWEHHLAEGGDPRDKRKFMRQLAKAERDKPKAGLRKRKQQQSASPNVIHSFDATHLCRTVNACSDGWLLADFAMIHDSFGVHAADTTLLSDVLRNEFIRIYEGTNWLQRIEDYVRGYAPDVKIPSWSEKITLGELELYPGVLHSQHFFS